MPEELSRNCFEVILQHDWSIEQCLLHIRVFFGGKTKSPCFVLSIHWLIKQITNTYGNLFSRSYENRSKQFIQVSGLYGSQFLSYLPKRFTHLCRALNGDVHSRRYILSRVALGTRMGDVVLVYRFGAPI